jgi:HEPN domain-containing protein
MTEEADLWWQKATQDLENAKRVFGIAIYDVASFLCQQSAEKALKAFLIETAGEFPKSHDVVGLGARAGLSEQLLLGCERLVLANTESRYPLEQLRDVTKEDAETDISAAEAVLKWVAERLSLDN